jgi:hypothetical protein
MPEALSKQSIVLINYPEDVYLPGDDPSTARSKGITDLTIAEQCHFVEALWDEKMLVHFEVKLEQQQGNGIFN